MLRASTTAFAAATCAVFASCAGATTIPTVLIDNINVVTMVDEKVLTDSVVVIEGQRIIYVGPRASAPAAAKTRRIDGGNGYLIPGLADMHVHLGRELAQPAPTDKELQNELLLYIAHGVTLVRNMSGQPWLLELREQVRDGNVFGPRIVTAGPVLESQPSNKSLLPQMSLVRTPQQAQEEVLRQKRAGYDFIKVYNDVDAGTYRAIVRAAHDNGMQVAGHVSIGAQLRGVLQARQDSIEHFRGYDLALSPRPYSLDPLTRFSGWPLATDDQLRKFALDTAAANVWNCPTLVVQSAAVPGRSSSDFSIPIATLSERLRRPTEQSLISTLLPEPAVRMIEEGVPAQQRLIRALSKAGAPLLVGTDTPIAPYLPGAGALAEIKLLRDAGLSNFAALQAATANPGRFLQRASRAQPPFGTIQPGSLADLVLLRGNPLDDLDNLHRVAAVMLRGSWYDSAQIQARLDQLASVPVAQSATGTPAIPPPAAKFPVREAASRRIPMRDGVHLSTDFFFPVIDDSVAQGKDRLPTILIRTPYDKRGDMLRRPVSVSQLFAGHGYAVAIQDVRGAFASEGEYQLAAHDVTDASDTFDWIAAQPWSNGKIGMYGCSLLGATQVKAAQSQNRHLVAILPQATATAHDRSHVFWKGGALELGASLPWFHMWGVKRRDLLESPPSSAVNWPEVMRTLPLLEMDERAGSPRTDWKDWLKHAPDDPWWHQFNFITPQSRIDVPALFVSSWYDHGIGQTLEQFSTFRRKAISRRARANQFIIISPTTHCGSEYLTTQNTVIGERALGDARFDFFGAYLRWYDHWLRGNQETAPKMPRVQYFVMGLGQWKSASDWPVPGTRPTAFYLSSDGRANSRFGSGSLALQPPGDEPADSYIYDPAFPVPSGAPVTVNALDQRTVQIRHDVLVYSTPPLQQGMEVTGHLKAKLYVSSSARDTDFTAKLVDVYPDGTAYLIQEGIARARYREGFDRRAWMKPGEVYELTIDMEATSNYFAAGHRILLEISSSSFPRFDRNLNTGGNNFDETLGVAARNVIHHDSTYPSHLLLPVIPAQGT